MVDHEKRMLDIYWLVCDLCGEDATEFGFNKVAVRCGMTSPFGWEVVKKSRDPADSGYWHFCAECVERADKRREEERKSGKFKHRRSRETILLEMLKTECPNLFKDGKVGK